MASAVVAVPMVSKCDDTRLCTPTDASSTRRRRVTMELLRACMGCDSGAGTWLKTWPWVPVAVHVARSPCLVPRCAGNPPSSRSRDRRLMGQSGHAVLSSLRTVPVHS
jgi:hypothetical protein